MKTIICLMIALIAVHAQYDENTAKRFLAYEKISYCDASSIQSWTCQSCGAFSNMQDVSVFTCTVHDSQAYVAYDGDNDNIIVSFRGSSNIKNWIADLDAVKVDYPACDQCQVHKGFLGVYNDLRDQVVSAVQNLCNKYSASPVVITGHSLGAAVATLAALDLANIVSNTISDVIHFGSPRVGNEQFANFFSNVFPYAFRVVHNKDIVPHLPTESMGFHHIPTEVWYNENCSTYQVCDGSGEDPNCSDSITVPSVSDHTDYFNTYTGCGDSFQDQIAQTN